MAHKQHQQGIHDTDLTEESPVQLDKHLIGEVIKDPLEINRLLHTLTKGHRPITVRVNQGNTLYNSLILLSDIDKNTLFIDDLSPVDETSPLPVGTKISFLASFQGSQISVKNIQVTQKNPQGYDNAYALSFPHQLRYKQRRKAFRVMIPQHLDATFYHDIHKGRISNISADGLGVVFEGQVFESKTQWEGDENILKDAKLMLGEHFNFCGDLEAKGFRYDVERDLTFCGYSFYELSHAQQKMIDRLVLDLQRQLRRQIT